MTAIKFERAWAMLTPEEAMSLRDALVTYFDTEQQRREDPWHFHAGDEMPHLVIGIGNPGSIA